MKCKCGHYLDEHEVMGSLKVTCRHVFNSPDGDLQCDCEEFTPSWMARLRPRFLLVLFSFCLSLSWMTACHPKRVPSAKRFEPVRRATYAYQRLNDGEFLVVARTPGDLDKALEEIGCDRDYVCLIEPIGGQYQVLQRKK